MNKKRRRLELARRAVGCANWEWLPGMRWTMTNPDAWPPYLREGRGIPPEGGEALPDFSDAATIGGLMHMVCRIEVEDVEAMVEGLERRQLMPLWVGEEGQS